MRLSEAQVSTFIFLALISVLVVIGIINSEKSPSSTSLKNSVTPTLYAENVKLRRFNPDETKKYTLLSKKIVGYLEKTEFLAPILRVEETKDRVIEAIAFRAEMHSKNELHMDGNVRLKIPARYQQPEILIRTDSALAKLDEDIVETLAPVQMTSIDSNGNARKAVYNFKSGELALNSNVRINYTSAKHNERK